MFDKAVQDRRFSPALVEEVAEQFGTSVSSVVYRYLMSGAFSEAILAGNFGWPKATS